MTKRNKRISEKHISPRRDWKRNWTILLLGANERAMLIRDYYNGKREIVGIMRYRIKVSFQMLEELERLYVSKQQKTPNGNFEENEQNEDSIVGLTVCFAVSSVGL